MRPVSSGSHPGPGHQIERLVEVPARQRLTSSVIADDARRLAVKAMPSVMPASAAATGSG